MPLQGSDFEQVVLRSDRPVLVAFLANWSRPCVVLNGALLAAMESCDRPATWFTLNADEHPDLSLLYGVDAVPTILFFYQGTCQARIIGTASKEAILAKLRALFPDTTG